MASSTASSAAQPRAAAGHMIRRKADDRIKCLIDDIASHKHRGLILLVGDRAKDQVVNLHLMLSRANHSAKLSVLWCMKDSPDFGSTSRKRQEKRARLEVKGGLATEATKEAFQTFLAQTAIRFCKYDETHKILGQTFGMAVLQDFEALSPNILARTTETVQGGGLIVILFRAMRSLKQLYTIAMHVHARYRTEARRDVVPRFNERFLLSLTDCRTALCLDDDLNVLPITQHMRDYGARQGPQRPVGAAEGGKAGRRAEYDEDVALQGRLRHEMELAAVKEKLKPSAEVGPLVQLCQTIDQAKTVLSLMQTVAAKALDTTCVVTAGRGRGKSAALGMAAAGAIAQGYSNIFCTAPSPENVQTLFAFAVRGLKELGYVERTDFEALEATSEEFSRCIIRIQVFRGHRQTIQFVAATDSAAFAQAELAIIDEAAALPLPLVRQMLGPYLVFLSSTVSGYEGTGRSLSLKLVADLRRRATGQPGGGALTLPPTTMATATSAAAGSARDSRKLRELVLQAPIRYGPDDPVEKWLNKLLCLDATAQAVPLHSTPHPNTCDLYYVDRDALFSYHPLAEALLQRIQALLVAAHYKNQPNDLQLLSDAPGHHLFLLCSSTLGSGDEGTHNDGASTTAQSEKAPATARQGEAGLPDIYCVIHACEEGQVSAAAVRRHISHGLRPSGDLIPYTLSQYFLEDGIAQLAGLRIVRIATNPELQRAGYGTRALQLLKRYYSGDLTLPPALLRDAHDGALTAAAASAEDASTRPTTTRTSADGAARDGRARGVTEDAAPQHDHTDEDATDTTQLPLRPRAHTSNLLSPLCERPYEVIDYLGTSFGLTTELYNFWKRAGYEVLYVRQGVNELTAEHSCVMLCPLGIDVAPLKREFQRRFLRLLSMPFRQLPTDLALSMLVEPAMQDAQKLTALTDLSEVAQRRVRVAGVAQATLDDLAPLLTESDLKRLQLFSTAFIEGGNVLDLAPTVARLYFGHRLLRLPDGKDGVLLSHAQAAVLLAVGLQGLTLEELSKQPVFAAVPLTQLRAFYQKSMSRIAEHLQQVQRLGHTGVATTQEDGTGGGEAAVAAAPPEGEETRELYDAQGKLIGLSVKRQVRTVVNTDTTLLRDASRAVVGADDKEAHKDLQHAFRRPKKGTRRRS